MDTKQRNGWNHKDIWTRRTNTFAVEVSRHSVDPHERWEGPHRWAVYAYIYPTHPIFPTFDGDKIWQPATEAMPLHCGCSYLRRHVDTDGRVTSIQVGADYNHLHDERFTREDEFGGKVERDADALVAYLSAAVSP